MQHVDAAVICAQVVHLLAVDLVPELLAHELDHVQRLCE
eukprot:CAMPEP_0185202620 /NCGR_PEP_ID=MMETSP1140-20130426/51424_1 /TAXON_ID=298111 /ORGANISM="Pavlova sp., Strain CCMP459" /LENGTH=38 /DNA_ID= /DNA_START= /DNA_END= /DNA_ORIENTATION=